MIASKVLGLNNPPRSRNVRMLNKNKTIAKFAINHSDLMRTFYIMKPWHSFIRMVKIKGRLMRLLTVLKNWEVEVWPLKYQWYSQCCSMNSYSSKFKRMPSVAKSKSTYPFLKTRRMSRIAITWSKDWRDCLTRTSIRILKSSCQFTSVCIISWRASKTSWSAVSLKRHSWYLDDITCTTFLQSGYISSLISMIRSSWLIRLWAVLNKP